MHRHEIAVLNALKRNKRQSLDRLLDETKLGRDEALWAVQNLASNGLVEVKKEARDEVKLTREGEEYASKGLPERALLKRLDAGPVGVGTLGKKDEQIGFMWAKKKGFVAIEKGNVSLTGKGREVANKGMEEERILKEIHTNKESYNKYKNTEAALELKKRGLIETKSREDIREIAITQKGVRAISGEASGSVEGIENIDSNMIKNRLWLGKKFKEYNVEAPVEAKEVAMRHPLRRLIEDIREAYLGLGFREVSGPIIEPSFWVFDYLFMPQDHPARDVQDTFFLSSPKTLPIKERPLVKRIKEEHETGWHTDWSEDLAMQAVPRTHTTSVTGRYIHEFVSQMNKSGEGRELPIKLFTVGRVFRNENIDYKHLADFYMTDGIIIGKNLTLANLFDTLLRIYNSLGVKIRFKPAYFPFVEPGVEVQVEQSGEWLELGGAGIIRREVSGVERGKLNVLAWGLGIERILLVKRRDIKSISSLYNSSTGWLRERTMV